MFETHSFTLFLISGFLLNIMPGPDMLYVVARSLGQGRLAGIISALGILSGCLFHIFFAAAGFTALLVTVPWIWSVIRWLGAIYLFWLGFRLFIQRGHSMVVDTPNPMPLSKIFYQGVLTNLLNPKIAFFFLAFLPQFVSPGRGSLSVQFIILGMIFNVNGTLILMVIALLASRLRGIMGTSAQNRWLPRLMGAVLIGLGVRLVL